MKHEGVAITGHYVKVWVNRDEARLYYGSNNIIPTNWSILRPIVDVDQYIPIVIRSSQVELWKNNPGKSEYILLNSEGN